MTQGTLRALSSWWVTTAVLLILLGVYVAFSFSRNPYPDWSRFLLHTRTGGCLLALLLVNLTAASIRIVVDRFRRPAVTDELARSFDSHLVAQIESGEELAAAAIWLVKHADVQAMGKSGIRRLTGRWSFLPGTVLRAGIVVFLGALFVSGQVRQSDDAVLHEGERKSVLGGDIVLVRLAADLPRDLLQVGEEGTFTLGGAAADLSAGGATGTVSPGFPTPMAGRYYRLVHLGYAQEIAVSTGGRIERISADLDVLPPGRVQVVPLAGGRFLTVSLAPEKVITKGLVTGRQYDLTQPSFLVVLQQGAVREQAPSATVRPGASARIGGSEVTLGRNARFALIRVVRDPALPFLYAGVVIMLLGLCAMLSRFFWYERELVVAVHRGELSIGYREEFFRKWGVEKFERWRGELPQSEQAP